MSMISALTLDCAVISCLLVLLPFQAPMILKIASILKNMAL